MNCSWLTTALSPRIILLCPVEACLSLTTLLMEGLDRVFKDRGLPSIAELTDKEH